MGRKANRKKREAKINAAKKGKWSIGKITRWLFLAALLCGLAAVIMKPWWLRTRGVCIKAVVLEEMARNGKRKPRTFKYRFELANKDYVGNTGLTDRNKVGDSICVVYLKLFPSVHETVSFLGEEKVRCNCNASAR